MMATMKYDEPRGLEAPTDVYGFYVRATGETRKLLKEVKNHLTQCLGAEPSNTRLLHALLLAYVEQAIAAEKEDV